MQYLADPSVENEQQLAAIVGPFSTPRAYVDQFLVCSRLQKETDRKRYRILKNV